jgi:hypothetical protein
MGAGGLTARGGGRTASLCSVGGLTAWVGGWTASLCSQGDLIAWSHCRIASLCSMSGRTTRERGLTASGGNTGGT